MKTPFLDMIKREPYPPQCLPTCKEDRGEPTGSLFGVPLYDLDKYTIVHAEGCPREAWAEERYRNQFDKKARA